MNKVKISLAVACFSLAAPAHSSATVTSDDTTVSVSYDQEIMAWAANWKRLIEAGDIEQMRDMYEPDAVLMANGAPPQFGVDAILKFLGRNKAAGNKVTIDFKNEDLTIEGNRGYLTAKYWMTISMARGSTINVMGRSFLVFKKGMDQKWRLWKDIDNQAPDISADDRPN